MKLEVIRQMDKLGRICIPKDFRKTFGITEDTHLFIAATEDGILLKPLKMEKYVDNNGEKGIF